MAQIQGKVSRPELGLEFDIPQQWSGQEIDGGMLLVSEQVPGLILIMLHEIDQLDALIAEAKQGIQEGFRTRLVPAGEIINFGNHGIALEYTGKIEGHPAKAHAIGLINAHGYGITILATTDPDNFSPVYKELAEEIANSFLFTEPEKAPQHEQWRQWLSDMSLRRMSSYSSGTSGGSNSQSRIDLCANGYFSYSSSSSMSIDVGGVFGNSSGNNSGQGTWEVLDAGNGNGLLRMSFNDGRVWEYQLSTNEKEETYLDGVRYFRIGKNDPNGFGPNCP
ncbi:MAG: hypothetical protein JJU28_24615 [Cyclobacteriaceae bacterium]|nr:hypothetical protein [Cyclobacteriaceae bacterium]